MEEAQRVGRLPQAAYASISTAQSPAWSPALGQVLAELPGAERQRTLTVVQAPPAAVPVRSPAGARQAGGLAKQLLAQVKVDQPRQKAEEMSVKVLLSKYLVGVVASRGGGALGGAALARGGNSRAQVA